MKQALEYTDVFAQDLERITLALSLQQLITWPRLQQSPLGKAH